ncbi:D-amino-acid transaminase [Paenibacillus hexagrammi]|uniref:D-alanine aminotransferase n=1 Tax=Paenibacillus hexagrammi TaxID=2908839 RepID=A0ABY3SC16_9BACL|nr:D-amino-acid transaminase [Paenibacillus sp. YPD9-1]UJF31514.1 D-amino-acid transaminase [Paenibacillus sp. YPD9-1]
MYFYKDSFVEKTDRMISPDDRGYYFGDGIYEVFRIYHGKVYEQEAHLVRLVRSAKDVRIELPYSLEQIREIITTLVKKSRISEGTLYMQITRGEAPRAHSFPQNGKPVMTAYCTDVPRPTDAMDNGIRAISQDDIRWLRCDLKTLNLLPNVLSKQAAVDHGVQEVVLHRGGIVTECSASNLMMVKNQILHTHPANHLILHGITRMVVLRLAHALKLEVREEPFTLEDLYQADEAFITGTTVEITPLVEIDNKPIGSGIPGTITKQLQQQFERTFSK